MFVIIWEPKRGFGGGHQLVLDHDKAEQMSKRLSRQRPDDVVRIEPAEAYAAAAVMERQRRHMTRRTSSRT